MGTAKMEIESYRDVKQNYAFVSCYASGWTLPEPSGASTGNEETGSSTKITYSNLTYLWTFSNNIPQANQQNVLVTFQYLKVGQPNLLTASLTVSCTQRIETISWITVITKKEVGKDEETGEPIYEEEKETIYSEPDISESIVEIGTIDTRLIVYTQPRKFLLFECYQDSDFISDVLTAYNWNNFINQLGVYMSWFFQINNYDGYEYLKITQGDWISASLLNSVLNILELNIQVKKGDLIKASLFRSLGEAVSP